jgi:hypothetical protein
MLSRMVLIALLVAASPAFAFDTTKLGQGGTLPLEDIQAVINQSSKLKHEVDDAIAKAGKKPDAIICDGMRFPGSWKELSGMRVSPYHCQIGGKWLTICTKVRVTDKKGKLYQSINRKAMNRADNVRETDPTWSWSDKEPK